MIKSYHISKTINNGNNKKKESIDIEDLAFRAKNNSSNSKRQLPISKYSIKDLDKYCKTYKKRFGNCLGCSMHVNITNENYVVLNNVCLIPLIEYTRKTVLEDHYLDIDDCED